MTHYDTCAAPICQELGGDVWYPDEVICNLRPNTSWQSVQKRLQTLYRKDQLDGQLYFSLRQLKTIKVVRPGIKGKR